ncbi:cell division protein FtsA [Thermosyntropha sp.]|uniref:cell division protein FtsA n=1 Tax=Thermosyntropha sp. TaxID=2740820 RepID=UPI0025DAC499|nr:cell division protein FtsA [Thermosyntropha sp.]MBO8159328.1 cell division protein FtsA [Thermosyntropha sp.]
MAVGLDIGTTSIKAALGEITYGQEVNILGVCQASSTGLRRGNIIDIENTANSIAECLHELQRLTGVEVYNAVVGFSSADILSINNRAVIAVGNPGSEILPEDKERVLKSAQNIPLPPDKIVVQKVEKQYIVDGYEGVKDPIGMIGSRLEAEVSVIVAKTAAVQNLYRSAERINLRIDRCIYNQLLAAETVLLPAEKEIGVLLIDIGGGTTKISFFEKGSFVHTVVLPVGGEYITRDLAIILKTSFDEALRIKEQYGVASPFFVEEGITVKIKNIQGNGTREVSVRTIAEIIQARILEIMELIQAQMESLGLMCKIPGGIVIVGGEALLPGMVEVIEECLGFPVRIGIPENVRGISGDFSVPQNASAVGAVAWAAKNMLLAHDGNNYARFNRLFDKLGYFVKDLFS